MIIGITGASGSGKSELAKLIRSEIVSHIPTAKISILREDDYYHEQSTLPLGDRVQVNYDHPSALDHDLLLEQLTAYRNSDRILAPIYDYEIHNRKPNLREIEFGDILIVEGILLFHRPSIRKQFDFKIFIDVPLDVCLSRRMERDTRERGRTAESVTQQFEQTVKPMYLEFTYPTKKHADLIVPNGGHNPIAVEVISTYLRNKLATQTRLDSDSSSS